jgi:hypothetical protein
VYASGDCTQDDAESTAQVSLGNYSDQPLGVLRQPFHVEMAVLRTALFS